MNNEQTTCLICGENLEDKYSLQLNCKHSYHYECLQTSLDYMNKNKTCDNRCLYCNQSFGLIPVVNGLKKLKYGIHWIDTPPEYENKKCDFILTRGKRKGEKCNKYCRVGYDKCSFHIKKSKS
jgi:hypothetical protein